MIGRIIWFAALFGIAAVTTAVQLDRQSAPKPALAPLVPEPFRSFAQPHIAASAADKGDPARALEEARRLIRRRPVPAEHLSLLAVAQAKAGLGEQAGLTIQIAGQRGWREKLAQESVLRLALGAGDLPEATRRFAALLLDNGTPDRLLLEVGPAIFAQPGGAARKTMAELVAGGARWHGQFLRRGAATMPPDAFVEVVTASKAIGAQYDCDELALTVSRLASRDRAAADTLDRAVGSCQPS